VTRAREAYHQLVTFKFADNAYHVKMEANPRNVPSFGRAKEVAVGSIFEFGVIHREALQLPRWVRMGLWRSKGLLELIHEAELKPASEKNHIASLPLHPLDVNGSFIYDLI
jgi:CRISPR-associated protein Csc1